MFKEPNELESLRKSFKSVHLSQTKIKDYLIKQIAAYKGNIYYEELESVGYNPDLKQLEAIFSTKQQTGYGGNLCSQGSVAFVRFYLDYGAGWEDQGCVGVSQHDIPTEMGCDKDNQKPLSFSAALSITPHTEYCQKHVLPKVRAILEWNSMPPADSPDYASVWGNTIESYIQIKPKKKFVFDHVKYNDLLELAVLNPHSKIADLAHLLPEGASLLSGVKEHMVDVELDLTDLSKLYAKEQVNPVRYALPAISKSLLTSYDLTHISSKIKSFENLNFNIGDVLAELNDTQANTSYEELMDIGLDYNNEVFVANFKIKRPSGYAGDLCHAGSLEYVTFWADWADNCTWTHLGSTTVNVHDIHDIPKEGLTYAALLPYDFSKFKKRCQSPEVVKIRAVLSWGHAPSTTDADKLEYYGNRLDRYILLRPRVGTDALSPLITVLGGIPVDKISDTTGLTLADAKFALNQLPVHEGSPFGGVVVIQGPSFEGHKYRIKTTNLNTGEVGYIQNSFVAVGWLTVPPYVQYTTVTAGLDSYYDYLPFGKNINNVLARWTPGTNDRFKIELEIQGVAGSFVKYIQMDNEAPLISLTVNDGGDCTHFSVGDNITGSYSVSDAYLLSFSVSGFGHVQTAPTSGTFSFNTTGVASPCGKIALIAYEKTIYNSASTNNHSYMERIICLQGS